MPGYDYDLAIIGSGPAGQRTAIQAAELGKRTVILEKEPRVGGINIYAGTVSKTMRDAVLYLTGYRERNIYGQSYAVKQNITMDDLMVRTRYVIQQQSDILQSQLANQPGGDDHRRGLFRRPPHPEGDDPRRTGPNGPSPPTRW